MMGFTRYQRFLFLFLCLALFFDGYDLFALSQTLPELRAMFSLSPAEGGRLLGLANLGMLASYFLTRLADRQGRRKILSLSLIAYPLLSGLSALAPGSGTFFLCQLGSRVFLSSAIALAIVYAAEEFPAARRGAALGMLQVSASLGAIFCAALTPTLLRGVWGWRGVYLVGALPLLPALAAPLFLRESERFAATATNRSELPSLLRLLKSPHKGRMMQLAGIWAATYMCTQSASSFWKEHALRSGMMNSGQAGASIAAAALLGLPATLMAGRLIDRIGRRRGAIVIYLLTFLGVLGAYWLPPGPLLIAALSLSIGGAGGAIILLSAFTTECFPTTLRSDAMAWANNLLGRLAYMASPLLVAWWGGRLGWAWAVSATAPFLLLAVVMIWCWLPETVGRDLADTAQTR